MSLQPDFLFFFLFTPFVWLCLGLNVANKQILSNHCVIHVLVTFDLMDQGLSHY